MKQIINIFENEYIIMFVLDLVNVLNRILKSKKPIKNIMLRIYMDS